MRIHRRNSLPEPPAGRADHTTDAPARRLRWRARHRRDRENVRQAPESAAGGNRTARVQAAPGETMAAETMAAETMAAEHGRSPGETMAAAMQLAIALLTAGLDSPELEAWAADALTPVDADGLGDFMAGLHVISVLLLNELHEVTGEPSAAILQRLAILAERGGGHPSPTKAGRLAGPVSAAARRGHLIVSPTVNSRYLLFVLVDEPAWPDRCDDDRGGRCDACEGAG